MLGVILFSSGRRRFSRLFFFFNDTATTEIYTLSLHDALPISPGGHRHRAAFGTPPPAAPPADRRSRRRDRKSTRLNSSHLVISYAVFCLKKKKQPLRASFCSCTHARRPASQYRCRGSYDRRN